MCTVVAAAIAASAPATAGAHSFGDAYGNCYSYLSTAKVESYTPAGVPVINRTRRRDRQTIWWRASLVYYGHPHYEGHAYEWAENFRLWRWGYGEWFRTTVAEYPGRRVTTPYWTRDLNGDVRAWGSSWTLSTEMSSKIEITLIWKQRGNVVHKHTAYLRSLNYPIPPGNVRSWQEWCYRYNGGYTAFWHPASMSTVYFPGGRTSGVEAASAGGKPRRAGEPRVGSAQSL